MKEIGKHFYIPKEASIQEPTIVNGSTPLVVEEHINEPLSSDEIKALQNQFAADMEEIAPDLKSHGLAQHYADSLFDKLVSNGAGVLNKWSLSRSDLLFILQHNAVFVPLSDGLENIFESIAKLQGTIIKIVDFSQDYEFADFDSEENVITKYCTNFDIIFIGGNENLITLISKLNQKYPSKLFVLTVGDKGSFAFHQTKKYFQNAVKTNKIVDTTGCGDSFQAGFVAVYLKHHNIQRALKVGAKQAASVITYIGSTKFTI